MDGAQRQGHPHRVRLPAAALCVGRHAVQQRRQARALTYERRHPELGSAWTLLRRTSVPPLETMRIYGGSDYAVTADAAITRSILWLGWIQKDACTCSTVGASSPHLTNGSKHSVILCLSGSL